MSGRVTKTSNGAVAGIVGLVLQLAGCGADVGAGSAANNGQTLCLSDFIACVNPIYNATMQNSGGLPVQCASSGCHELGSGSGGSLRVYPNSVDAGELQINFISSLSNANLGAPASSKLLTKPVAGPVGHAGGDIIPDSSDPCYAAILAWVTNSVVDQADPVACGNCIVPALASCGYP